MNAAGLVALADAADALARLARAVAQETPTNADDDLLPLHVAAAIASTSVRSLKDAKRRGELELLGRERSRVVRRRDLVAWIEGRGALSTIGPEDAELDARVERLKARRKRSSK
jgi:hypothetical protein